MNRICFPENTNLHVQNQHANCTQPLRKNFARIRGTACLLLLMLIGIVACEEKEVADKESDQSGFVAVGRQWVYEYFAEGALESTTYTYKVLSNEGDGFYNIQTKIADLPAHSEFYWYAKNGDFADETMTFPFDTYFILMPGSPTLNQNWDSPEADDDLGTINRKVVAHTESITVPAGTFNDCVKISESFSNDPNIISYYWVNEEAGVIAKQITSWYELNDEPRKYFQVSIKLKSKNF